MDKRIFARIAESLRQYRRADLPDFPEIGANPVDATYVDPLPDDAVLQTMLSSSTTFLLGRKGTGKSTVFAKAQSEIRRRNQSVSVYVDVKSLYDLLAADDISVVDAAKETVHPTVMRAHRLRKSFLGAVLGDLLKEIDASFDRLSLYDRWIGKKRDYSDVRAHLERLRGEVKSGKLSEEELPILRTISTKVKDRAQETERQENSASARGRISPTGASASGQIKETAFEETLSDKEVYQSYSDAVLRSFPYAELISEIRDLLDEVGMKRLVVFFDDFSELTRPGRRGSLRAIRQE